MEKVEKLSEKKAQIQAETMKKMGQLKGKGDENMEKVNESAAKVNENTEKKENTMKNEAIIDDRTEETKAKTRKLNKKGGDTKKKPAKTTRKPQKKEEVMTNKELLVQELKKIAAKDASFSLTELRKKKSEVITGYRLKKDGMNILSVREQDVLVFKPVEIFNKTLQKNIPSFKKEGKRKDGTYGEIYAHYTHIRHSLEAKHLSDMVAAVLRDKKSSTEWMKKLEAQPKAYYGEKKAVDNLAALKAKQKKLEMEIKALEMAEKKAKKPAKSKAKKAAKKASNVISKVAEAVA